MIVPENCLRLFWLVSFRGSEVWQANPISPPWSFVDEVLISRLVNINSPVCY